MSNYALTFDLNTKDEATGLPQTYGKQNWQNAYADIGKILSEFGFKRMENNFYVDGEDSSKVYMAVTECVKVLPWFAPSVNRIHIMRVEEDSDLLGFVARLVS